MELGGDGNKGMFCIPQSSRITGTSPSDCSVSYPGHSSGGVLPLFRGAVSVFYSPSRLGKTTKDYLKRLHMALAFPRFDRKFVQLFFLGKGMNPIILPPAVSKKKTKLGMETNVGEGRF